jgi:nitroreductase
MFTGTIRENLLLAKKDATDEELFAALEQACADFVRENPLGLDAPIKEQGIGFSQGQLQRLCIARALLADAPVLLVISEKPYCKSAALGAKVKGNDYRSIDIGIVAAYITAEAEAQGLGSCILGWLDDEKIRAICNLDGAIRLVITIGYAKEGDKLRPKKRKDMEELVTWIA